VTAVALNFAADWLLLSQGGANGRHAHAEIACETIVVIGTSIETTKNVPTPMARTTGISLLRTTTQRRRL